MSSRKLIYIVQLFWFFTHDRRCGPDVIASEGLVYEELTEEPAGALEETGSSMEELASTVKLNADNARRANTMAASTSSVAARGGEVIGDVVEPMAQIHAASGKITDIISVSDGIAFETNILAPNTAVEAGSRLVREAGSTMHDIVESVRRVTDNRDEITTASQEQSAGIEQINEAITQIDYVTQQNAALVGEAAASAQSMQEQAVELTAAVAVHPHVRSRARAWRAAGKSSDPLIAALWRPCSAPTSPGRAALPPRLVAHGRSSSRSW